MVELAPSGWLGVEEVMTGSLPNAGRALLATFLNPPQEDQVWRGRAFMLAPGEVRPLMIAPPTPPPPQTPSCGRRLQRRSPPTPNQKKNSPWATAAESAMHARKARAVRAMV